MKIMAAIGFILLVLWLVDIYNYQHEIRQLKSRNEYMRKRVDFLQSQNDKFRDSVVFSDTIVIALPEGQRRILYRVEGKLHE